MEDKRSSFAGETTNEVLSSSVSLEKSNSVADDFEPINIEWVHFPGSEVSRSWEPRKRKSRHLDTKIRLESEVSQSWEPRKWKSQHLDTKTRLESDI